MDVLEVAVVGALATPIQEHPMTQAFALLKRLGYKFKNETLLREALTHASSNNGASGPTYERLEFLGDRVLGLAIAEALFAAFPNAKEGDLAPRFTALVRAETCALVAEALDLGGSLILGESELQSGGRGKPAILADACEALIGAIFLDGGYEAARDFVLRNWRPHIENPPQLLRDAKTRLQEWAQGKGYDLPVYEIIERTGPDHAPSFVMQVQVADLQPVQGSGSTKRLAEQEAAEKFLQHESGRSEI